MPRDRRLYMTFPIDFDEHPKVVPLSDAAFRVFVAMNGYSRRNDLDGRIPIAVACSKWKRRALTELVESHPERPLVVIDGGSYVIREYAEHQFTTADLEGLRAKRAAAGAKGGRAKAANAKQNAAKVTASVTASAKQTGTRDQGSENYQDLNNHPEPHSGSSPDDLPLDPTLSEVLGAIADHGIELSPLVAADVIAFLDSRRPANADPPKVPTRYYPKSIHRSWPEVEKFIYEKGLAS